MKKKEVRHIADLARIEFTDAELEKFETELDSVLNFVGELSTADTGSVSTLSGVFKESFPLSVMREDRERVSLGDSDALMKAAPKIEGRWIAVKAVF